MNTDKQTSDKLDPWRGEGPALAVGQVAQIVQQKLPALTAQQVSSDGFEISGTREVDSGVLTVRIRLHEDPREPLISLKAKLASKIANGWRAEILGVLRQLRTLNENCRIDVEPAAEADRWDIWSELLISAKPLTLTREAALQGELDKLTALARALQAELPAREVAPDLAKVYEPVLDVLEPVLPLANAGLAIRDWARASVELLLGGACLAVATVHDGSIAAEYALAAIASAAWDAAQLTLGRLLVPAINARGVIEIASKAPGIAVVPAVRLSLASNVYELGSEARCLLSTLGDSGRVVVFTGTVAELQATFGGGQGSAGDPLRPILQHIPALDWNEIVRFAVVAAGRRSGGIPSAVESQLVHATLQALQRSGLAERERLLPLIATRLVHAWSRGGQSDAATLAGYVDSLQATRETLGGICVRPRVQRNPQVQEQFSRVLADPSLRERLRERLVGQDAALTELASRLRAECLTRPLHQPLRFCSEGPPASGKSSSVALLAEFLDIPLINIDAASMSDHYTASAQLLGSGRGIVGSHQAGRLEQVAKHHRGAVVEISDLDHAVPAVRSALADLFLQVLETGEAQSATGAMFGCANLLLSFTMNLPGGRDEDLRKHLGFVSQPKREDIRSDVTSEIQHLLSAAFLSRVGSPILFEPLSGRALAAILQRAIVSALQTASERLHLEVADVVCDEGLGAAILSARDLDAVCAGARGLLELGRGLATEALLVFLRQQPPPAGRVLRVSADATHRLVVHTSSENGVGSQPGDRRPLRRRTP